MISDHWEFLFSLGVFLLGVVTVSDAAKAIPSAFRPFEPFPPEKPYADKTRPARERAVALLHEMTLDEKIQMLGGFSGPHLPPVERLGMRPLRMADASQGLHIRDTWPGNTLEKTTAFPCTLALAATWDTNRVYTYAQAIAEQCRAGDISFLLGPGMNLYRLSTCGRNFEYMGEDPYLVARLIEQYVRGIQDTGVIATIKHFVCNNMEVDRTKSNSVVAERPLHELYLPAFQAGIDAGAGAVMTAYNQVNGEWCGQSDYVINGLLRGDLGFDGLVMTDWGGSYDAEKIVKSSMDLVMPNAARPLHNLRDLLADGTVVEADIDRMVISTMTAAFKMGLYDRPQLDPAMLDRYPEHERIALDTAREGMVLLKNEGVLPLDPERVHKVLLVGRAGDIYAGGGSGFVAGYDHVSFAAAMQKEFGDRVTLVPDATEAEIAAAENVIAFVYTMDHENRDQPFELDAAQEALVKKCVAANPRTVVVAMAGSGIRMTDWAAKAGAILYAWYGGQYQGTALVDILTGRINPSAKLPMTIEQEFADSPDPDYIPADRDMTVRSKDQAVFDVNYDEGVFIGYRWYEKKKIAPLFPFGHGLSYTTFAYDQLALSSDTLEGDDRLTVRFRVQNTGDRAGAEIAQLYVQDPVSSVDRPVKELKGFRKIRLAPGESQTVSLEIGRKDLSFWSPETRSWVAEPGRFNVLVGASSADIKLTATFEYRATKTP